MSTQDRIHPVGRGRTGGAVLAASLSELVAEGKFGKRNDGMC